MDSSELLFHIGAFHQTGNLILGVVHILKVPLGLSWGGGKFSVMFFLDHSKEVWGHDNTSAVAWLALYSSGD